MSSDGCVFCAIARGDAPASLVHEDDVCVAFMDIAPITDGHLLVAPKEHATGLADLPPETGGHLFRVAQQAAARVRSSGIRCEGLNLFLADGAVAGQTVLHLHVHVLPRSEGDSFRLSFVQGSPPREALDELAARLRF